MTEPFEDGERWYPLHPWVGVGVVVIKEGRLLLIKRGKEPYKGKWSIPGGGLELGETLSQAAARETYEECSIRVKFERVLDTVDEIFRDEKGRVVYHFIDIDVVAGYVSGEAGAQSDAEECRWVDLEEIAGMDIPDNLRAMLKRNKIVNE